MFEDELDADPIAQFDAWYREAGTDEVALATASASDDGPQPSVRMVLLKGHDERGFAIYTNYTSRKAQDLTANPRAALLFHWPGRQVRVEGAVTRVDNAESHAYWRNRPRASQLSAWASRQSEVVESRAALEQRVEQLETRFPDDVPPPPFWGGYRVHPEVIEFWRHREDRLHDRLRYRLVDGNWMRERLAP